MKKINKKISLVGLVVALGLTVASCDLDLLPLNEVVLENFWTNKQDVQSVVSSCYLGIQEEGCVEKMVLWGEGRSDNIVEGQDVGEDLKNMLNGNMKTTNTICDWQSFYVVINRCNIVEHYAPEVAEKDPNYSNSDLAVNLAEVKTLRALMYFELVKAFGRVPFSFTPSIDDSQPYFLTQTDGELIIDTLIMDLEKYKDAAPRRFAHDMRSSTGKVTRAAIYSLLADLYLWRASDNYSANKLTPEQQKQYYQKCIECCDYVMQFKTYEYNLDEEGDMVKQVDRDVYSEFRFPLLAEEKEGKNTEGPLATNAIFGKGNSFESIFELTYEDTQDDAKQKNEAVSTLYGNSSSAGGGRSQQLSANTQLITEEIKNTVYNDEKIFSCVTDYRSIASFKYDDQDVFKILKYVVASNKAGSSNDYGKVSSSKWTKPSHAVDQDVRSSGSRTEGWIFYRITDVMLMRAEAEVCLASLINPETVNTNTVSLSSSNLMISQQASALSSDTLLYQDAFNLVSAVYLRSNPGAWDNSQCKPQASSYTSCGQLLQLVELERQRELMFEGKRYYDLVRHSRRDGNTNWFKSKISSKFSQASRAAMVKMNKMEFMYLPVLKDQMKINPKLIQNPCYYDEEEVVKN